VRGYFQLGWRVARSVTLVRRKVPAEDAGVMPPNLVLMKVWAEPVSEGM